MSLECAICVGLFLAVLAVYSEVGHFLFITFDDPFYVTENAHVRAGLSAESIKWALTAIVDGNWMPVTMLSHIATTGVFGLRSGMHHWVNVLLHALASVLLFAFLKRATRTLWPSAFVAFVFALHPLHVESVAWIAERKDVLSTLLFFLTLYAYVLYAERPVLRRYLWVAGLFSLGLMAKPMLVTLPFALLLLDVWPLRRAELPRMLTEKIPLFILSLISSAITYSVQQSAGAVQRTSLADNVKNAFISYVSYIGQMFWPSGLTLMVPPRQAIATWQVIGAAVLLAGICALAVITWRSRPYIATGWFWYLGTLVPVIGLVPVGIQAHADRYMYVPMTGLCIILAWGAADIIQKRPQTKVWFATVAVASCTACLVLASAQTQYWRTSETLYQRALSVTENNFAAEYNLGEYLMDVPDRGADAVAHIEAALRIQPDSADALNILGAYLLQNGRDAEARLQFEQALRAQPQSAEAHFNLGLILEKTPLEIPDAITHYTAAVNAKPDWARAHKNLGILLLKAGRTQDASSELQRSEKIQSDPEVESILRQLGGVAP
jgi:tetratricopeptide (TPR) repeat protein